MSDTIPAAQLQAADVLLFRGTGWLAKAIRFFDGTDFNHAGLYMGDPSVAEALKPGVVRQSLVESLKGRQRVIARRLINPPPTMTPVTAVAETVLAAGHRYAFEQLLLLALLCLTRKLPMTPWLRPLVRKALDAAAGLLAGILGQGKEPMICSEFVYRCYDQALPEAQDVYALEINRFPREGAPPGVRGRAAARAAAPHGRGVHPDSLLSWRLSAGARGVAFAPRAARRRKAPAPPDVAEVEKLAERYLNDLQGVRVRGAAPKVSDEDLIASIDAFAVAYLRPRARAGRVPAALGPEVAVRGLMDTVPDFVTPGDLLSSGSLYTVGDLELP